MTRSELVLAAEVDAVPQARRFAAESLADEPVDVVDAAELIITELMTNAALHGRGPVTVRIRPAGDRVRVEVEDTGNGVPMIPAQSTDAMTGRGLRLVAALSASWGVEPAAAGGKTVWAELSPNGEASDMFEPEIDVDALLAAWEDDEPAEPHFTVRLGAVPTELLLAAKAHIDNVVREARLAEGADYGTNTPQLAALIETVTRGFASARAEIKRQALAAAARGDAETELVLNQPASAAAAGEQYLEALDLADQYARHAQLLTLEPPPVHRLFRRWYVQALVDQLRARAADIEAPPAPTFLQVLAREVEAIAPLRDAAQRLEMLQTIASQLTTARTVEEIADVVVSNATAFLGALSGRVFVVDGEDLRSVAEHGTAPEGIESFDRIPLDANLPGPVALRTGKPLVLRNLEHLREQFPAVRGITGLDRTMHVSPLVIGDHALGVLALSFPVDGRLDAEAQASFVRALADALAQALERAGAIEAAQLANERLAFLADASVALSASLDHSETAAAVGDLLVPRLADWFVLQVVEGDGELLTVALKHFDPAKVAWAERMTGLYPADMNAPTGAPNVIRTGRGELYPEIPMELVEASARSEEHLELLRQLGMRSAVVVPLAGRAGVFGAITLIFAESGRSYTEQDMAFAEDVARRAALALENARVFREQSGRLASVTRVAEAAQHAILAPPPAQIGPVALAARYVSAAAEALVGGDLYEVVARPGAVRLLIGDVRGKGLAAVRTATVVLGEFRAAAADVDDLAGVARQIDRRVRAYLSEEDFITALIAEVADDGTFTVAACGHPPALLASGNVVTAVDCPAALPLGLGAEPVVATGQLAIGDRLVLMTDGILEARSPDHEFVQLDGLVSGVGRGDLEAALDQVLAALHEAVGPELGDDLALLAAEYTGRSD